MLIDAGAGGYGPKIPRTILDKVKTLTVEEKLVWVNNYNLKSDYPDTYKAFYNKIEYTYYLTGFGWVLMMIQDTPWKYERYTVGRRSSLTYMIKKATLGIGKLTLQEALEGMICSWMLNK